MDWNAFVEGIKEFFAQPVPIIGCTIGALCIAILSILARTSVGKKSLKKLTNLYNDGKTKVDGVYNEYQAFKKEKEQQLKQLESEYVYYKEQVKKEYENKLAIATSQIDNLRTLLLDISANLHNNKIKEIVESYKENANTEIKGISEIIDKEVDNARITYKEQFEQEIKCIAENYSKIIEELKNEILGLKEQVELNVHEAQESVLNGVKSTKETILQDKAE